MTQNELAGKIGRKRSFISKVERDGSNLTLSTLYDIVMKGLGGNLTYKFNFENLHYVLSKFIIAQSFEGNFASRHGAVLILVFGALVLQLFYNGEMIAL